MCHLCAMQRQRGSLSYFWVGLLWFGFGLDGWVLGLGVGGVPGRVSVGRLWFGFGVGGCILVFGPAGQPIRTNRCAQPVPRNAINRAIARGRRAAPKASPAGQAAVKAKAAAKAKAKFYMKLKK